MNCAVTDVACLIDLGANLSDKWVEKLDPGLQASEIFNLYLDSDLSDSSCPLIDNTMTQADKYCLEKNIILQVNEVVDIESSQSDRREFRNHEGHTMKCLLSDGFHHIIAITKDITNDFDPLMKKGKKIQIRPSVSMRFGVLLLKYDDYKIIGGYSGEITKNFVSTVVYDPKGYNADLAKALNNNSVDDSSKTTKPKRQTTKKKSEVEIVPKPPRKPRAKKSAEQSENASITKKASTKKKSKVVTMNENHLNLVLQPKEANTQTIDQNFDDVVEIPKMPTNPMVLNETKHVEQNQVIQQKKINTVSSYLDDLSSDDFDDIGSPMINLITEGKPIEIPKQVRPYTVEELKNLEYTRTLIESCAKISDVSNFSIIKKMGIYYYTLDCMLRDETGEIKIRVEPQALVIGFDLDPEQYMKLSEKDKREKFSLIKGQILNLFPPVQLIDQGKETNGFRYLLESF